MLAHTPVLRRAALATATALLIAGLAAAIDTRESAPRFSRQEPRWRASSRTNRSKAKSSCCSFWATWCGFCRRDQPPVDAIVHDFESQGLVVLAVNVGESKSKVKKYLPGLAARLQNRGHRGHQPSPRTTVRARTRRSTFDSRPAHGRPSHALAARGGGRARGSLLAKAGLKSE